MNHQTMDTILLVCQDEDYSINLIQGLQGIGANVVGPVGDGDMALALAAQTSPNLAILADQPTCARDAAGLAHELHEIWGVRSLVLDESPRHTADQPWSPEPEALERLIDALAQAEATRQ